MKIHAIIGKNFGDEGKGLAVDYFASKAVLKGNKCLVVRHNGGAQAGHTVDLHNNRFVFHQLSSGSFRKADTFWANTFLPDLYKLTEEIDNFYQASGFSPRIYSFGGCRCVYIDDILINMALECSRGDNRHGSCGMGINESVQRSSISDFILDLNWICGSSASDLYSRLLFIRENYVPFRLKELGLSFSTMGEYSELLNDNNVLKNVSEAMCCASESVILVSSEHLKNYNEIIFEGAQGLLLDEHYQQYAPHLTTSRTGLHNPIRFCDEYFAGECIEAVYITRSYVTRHGNGPLPFEGYFDPLKYGTFDHTNIPNDWQGELRYATHGDCNSFITPIIDDIANNCGTNIMPSLFITHLNETMGNICSINGNISVNEWCNANEISDVITKFYFSYSPFADEIK